MIIKRDIYGFAFDVLDKYNKMLFISGPRQSGKTTFSRDMLKKIKQGTYINWDIINDQKKIINDPYFFQKENRNPKKKFLVVFDEIHKYKNWRNYLKGCFDGFGSEFSFIVTGSGRLDLFNKGGDSLFGRYFGVNLFPLSLGELKGGNADFADSLSRGFGERDSWRTYTQLFDYSGFPEPFLRKDRKFYNLWSNERKRTLIREDIRSAYAVKDISNIEILSNLLPYRIGSPLSINSLREYLNAAFESIKKWLLILERFYYFFSVMPYSKSLSRAIKKEVKVYLYDWVEVEDAAARFENVVAFHLYKAVNLWKSFGYGNFELFYVRDKDGREADFLIVKDGKPYVIIEAKAAEHNVSKNLIFFQQKLKVPFAVQIINESGALKRISSGGCLQYIVSADNFLSCLP